MLWSVVIWVGVCGAGCGAGRGNDSPGDGGVTDTMPGVDARPTDPALAALAALSVSAGALDPSFSPEITEYHLDLLLAESAVVFTAAASDPDHATLTIDAGGAAVGQATASRTFALGSRDVEITVANGAASASYRVHVHRGVDAVSALTPTSGALVPAFDPTVTAYAIALPLRTDLEGFTPVALIPERATIRVNDAVVASGTESPDQPLVPGSNAALIVVSPLTRPAQARAYAVDAGRGIDALAAIQLSYADGTVTNTLSPSFDPDSATYTVTVGKWLRAVQVAATPLVAGGTVAIDGHDVQPGAPSAPIPLSVGTRSIGVVITAPGGDTKSYTVSVTRNPQVAQLAEQQSSNPDLGDLFGDRIAIDGDTLVVGAEWESSSATGIDGDQHNNDAPGSGAAYVFTRIAGAWSQQAYLKASNAEPGDHFGTSVAVSGDTIAVGAWGERSRASGVDGDQRDNSQPAAGAVYVFRRVAGVWHQEAYLKASNAQADAQFASVALHGDVLVVGASGEDSAATGVDGDQGNQDARDAGAAYVFTRSGTTWTQRAYLKASNTRAGVLFGSAVAVWGNTVVVGSPYESSGVDPDISDVEKSGAAYVFTRDSAGWSQKAMLKALFPQVRGTFGTAIALWRDTLAIGAPHIIGPGGGSGEVDIFERNGAGWRTPQVRIAPAPSDHDYFGAQLALWGDTLVAGINGDSSAATGIDGDPHAPGGPILSGAVQVFDRDGGFWVSETYLKAANPTAEASFCVVAVSGDTVIVGAPGTGGRPLGTGSFYVFQ